MLNIAAKLNDWKQFFFMIFIKFYLIPFTQGVNHLHNLYRNEISIILKTSEFYDVIVKIWRSDDVTSDFFTSIERLLSNYHSFHHSSLSLRVIISYFFSLRYNTPPHWYDTLYQNIDTQTINDFVTTQKYLNLLSL